MGSKKSDPTFSKCNQWDRNIRKTFSYPMVLFLNWWYLLEFWRGQFVKSNQKLQTLTHPPVPSGLLLPYSAPTCSFDFHGAERLQRLKCVIMNAAVWDIWCSYLPSYQSWLDRALWSGSNQNVNVDSRSTAQANNGQTSLYSTKERKVSKGNMNISSSSSCLFFFTKII